MFLDDYNEETFKREVRAEAFQEGREEAFTTVATDMIMAGDLPVSFISKYCRLPEDTIREMAAKLNVKL